MRFPLSYFLLVSGTMALGSCVFGPDPGSPDYEVPVSIRNDSYPHGTSFGDKSWKSVFKDSTLRELIERALKNNPDLVAATYRIEQARQQALASRADWYPQVGGSGGATSNLLSLNADQVATGADRTYESFNLTTSLSWEVDMWGRIRRSNEAARARFLQAGYQKDAIQTSLVASVATAYIQLKNLDERLQISRRTEKSRAASLELVTARSEGGVSSDLEVGQAKALLSQARVAIPITEQAITEKENEIRYLIGEFPGSVVRGGSLAGLVSSLKIKGGLPSELLNRRPDLAAADQAFQAAVADIGVAEALRLPSLSLTGSGGVVSQGLGSLLEGKSGAYSIGPDLAGPIFDGGRNKARAEATRAAAGESLANYDAAAKQAFREASNALNAHVKTGQISAQQEELVQTNRRVAEVANDRFEGGASSYLEVLDAERNLFTSELEFADSQRDRLLAVVQSYRALGGGWK
ncbi:efflux transporter outer membrane subunit [Luteolibacter sp. AS25]|uniref:efflux transporter outer membrane subunit n=1 Tax=Luteolibacter sp. AS25 TaxID=3135776 RepID=UPI00398AD194